MAERIRRVVEWTTTEFEMQPICVTASVGLALFHNEADLTLEHLIDRADQALYQSKKEGRNRVTIWQETYN